MPHVNAKLWPSKTEAQKLTFSDAIARAMTAIQEYGVEAISVGFEELVQARWSAVLRPVKPLFFFTAGVIVMTTSNASAQQPNVAGRRFSPEQVRAVAPALERYTQDRLYGDVWKRPGLNRRDRSLVTIAALIARGQAGALTYYADQALDNGVKPGEISETITHLAYYSGWGNAMAAVGPVGAVFAKRGIGADQLPADEPHPSPLDEAAEAQRAKNVGDQFGEVSPALADYTTDYLFRDLWLRPDLAPRDRSLITVAALIASGQVAQVTFHLNRAMDNGLTQKQAAEVIAHLAFYAGWPNAMSALPVAKDVFAKRSQSSEAK